MIADCAIEPEVFASWRHFQSLYEDFGVHRGRLISKYPKKWWVRRVAELARKYATEQGGMINTELQAARIEERLRSERFKRKTKPPGGREYSGDETGWMQATCRAEPPFDLIIGRHAGPSPKAVAAEDLMKDDPPFHRRSQVVLERRKEEIVGAAALLLGCCDELVLVDPNLRPDEPRFSATILHLMETWRGCRSQSPKRFEIHTNRPRNRNDTFMRGPQMGKWNAHIVPHLPASWSLTVCYWDKLPAGGKPHARFLLTELGGLYYDYGLDEGEDDPPGQTLVSLLDEEVWDEVFRVFDSRALPAEFDQAEYRMNFC